MNKALTIAGSDCSGGAGIQADLKTFMAFRVFGMSAITAVVAENTVGVQAVHELPVEMVVQQIKSCVEDIGVDAVKIGMLSNPEIVTAVARCVRELELPNVVVDPVMVAKSGDPLLSEEARETVREQLLPLARVITPNRYEAEVLAGLPIADLDDMKRAARGLKETGCEWVVVKGGHVRGGSEAIDVAYDGREFHAYAAPLVNTPNTHGTGCTFSSAIAAGLAKGYEPATAFDRAKAYISRAIQDGLAIGHGHGPANHLVGVASDW
ncbi:MAG: bifunctional hydroxymethylpyrimidine kinase/phosphomethylpyrimidine kinase [Acidobacteriota bacterium]|jgi:hydroxymethylpyrimidine/phosphomethylpyrimidine kinase